MRVKKVKVKKSSTLQKVTVPLFCVGLGILATVSVSKFLVHAADTTIHGCVDKKGNLRVLIGSDTCDKKETPLDWNQQGGSSGSSALVCPHCTVKDILARTGFTVTSGQNFDYANLSEGVFNNGEDFSNSSFVKAVLAEIHTNNDFQNRTNFTGANFTDANLTNANLLGDNLSDANFTRAKLEGAYLLDANMTGAILIDTGWKNTICPDGTNSDNNGSTCVGHLVP